MGALDTLFRYGQPAATLLSGAAAEPLAGLAGLLSGNADNVGKVRDALTYQPSTDAGQGGLQDLGSVFNSLKKTFVDDNPPVQKMVDGYNSLSDAAGDLHPALGAAMKTLPTAATLFAGPGSAATRGAFSSVAGDMAAVAPQIGQGILQMGKNAAIPQTLNKQAGVINWPGAPSQVYHGSGKEFDKFDMGKIQSNTQANDAGIGWHFSDNKSDAGFYADMGARNLGVDKGHIGKWDLDMKSPLVIGIDAADGNVPANLMQTFLNDKLLAKEYAIKHGHDGIIYPYGTNVDSAWTGILFDGAKAKKLP